MTAPATMEALLVEALPEGPEWRFEPKWDGFRCLAVRQGGEVALWSRSGKPLGRYFPEVEALIARLPGQHLILDGELIIETGDGLSFDALSQRLHPAASRIHKLATETPAQFMAFDLLQEGQEELSTFPLSRRRLRLEQLVSKADAAGLLLSPQTADPDLAREWLRRSGGALDGVIAKRADDPYRAGERAMLKIKQHRSADCVVGGYRTAAAGGVASLLLGLYDDSGLLNHVGFCSGLKATERRAWAETLAPLSGGEGFTGKRPDKSSRWSRERSNDWIPLRPELVVEVCYDQVTAGRFRHGARLLRRRPDKSPDQCRCDQLDHPLSPIALRELLSA